MARSPTGPERSRSDARDDGPVGSERAATHRTTEDAAPGAIKDGHGEIQPDPFPGRPDQAGNVGPDRDVIEQHRADAHHLERHRTGATDETLGTVTESDDSGG